MHATVMWQLALHLSLAFNQLAGCFASSCLDSLQCAADACYVHCVGSAHAQLDINWFACSVLTLP